MAPASPVRHVWIWSGALAFLLSFVWYTRRKNSLKSDPGGTPKASTPDKQEDTASQDMVVVAESTHTDKAVVEENRVEVTVGHFQVEANPPKVEAVSSKEETVPLKVDADHSEVDVDFSRVDADHSKSETDHLKVEAEVVATLCEVQAEPPPAETPQVEEVSTPSTMKEAKEEVVEVAVAAQPSQDKAQEVKVEALEGKLASLALTDEQRRGADRDSANHSPADAMLASPSMSSYSDEHSEGSSDSGKGCSDVASPPSRTPVGSGSLAGDADGYAGVDSSNSFSIYEFLLPQILVGRLIGRQGSFVQEIKSKTNAHIWIKKHPESSKQKICSIEGTPADIDSALALIRERFPLRKYPSVTLEQVSFVPAACTFPLVPDFCQLHLVEGVNNEVMISSLVSPAHMFLQQPYHPSYQFLQRLNHMMNSVYAQVETPNLPDPIEAGNICVAPAIDGWYRAQIVSSNEESQTSEIKFVDYGGYLTVNNSVLRQIRQDFMTLPFQATECYLANIKPSGETTEWSLEALRIVEELTRGQMLLAQVYDYAADGVPLIYLYSSINSQVVLINQDLVARGLADLDETVCSASSAEAASLVVAAAEAAAAAALAAATAATAVNDTPSSSSEKEEDKKTLTVESTTTPEVAAT